MNIYNNYKNGGWFELYNPNEGEVKSRNSEKEK